MIQLIAIDLDGTFLTDDKAITPENIATLREAIAHGVRIVICTGRTLPGVRRFLSQLPFFAEGDYIILQNGAVTHTLPNLDIVRQDTVSSRSRQQAWEIAQAFRQEGAQMVAFNQDNLFLIGDTEPSAYVMSDAETLETAITPMDVATFMEAEFLNKMMILGPQDVLNRLEASIPATFYELVNVVRSQPIIVEFLPKGVNKRSGVAALANQLGIQATNIMAIGDQLNDLEMLEYAGLSVAMGNAVPEVRAIADVVTDSNNASGVAQAIHAYVLNQLN